MLCSQFPLISAINDTSLKCARLRKDNIILTDNNYLAAPTQMVLFIIADQSESTTPFVNIIINFTQSSNSPSSVNHIRLALLVIGSNFTINNNTNNSYSPYTILIFQWNDPAGNTSDLVDIIGLEPWEYETSTSLCKWNFDRWNRILNGKTPMDVSYVYFLATQQSQLIFTLTKTINRLVPLPPYLSVLYCIPYKLGVTEVIIIICFSILFTITIIILAILHFCKGEDIRIRYLELRHNEKVQNITPQATPKSVRHRTSASDSSSEQNSTAT